MKQTNNAIKFLMAQYRAIFKNANIAMVAAMAAAALAAGSANAADQSGQQQQATNITDWTTITSGTIDGSNGKALAIVAAKDKTESNGFDLTITSGSHTIKGASGHHTLTTANGKTTTITLNGAGTNADQPTLTIGSATQNEHVDVTITNLNNYAGTLSIVGSGAASSLTATNIQIGGSAPAAGGTTKAGTESKAVVSLGASGEIIAAEGGTFNILSGGELKFAGAASKATANSGIVLNGGKISVADSGTGTVAGALTVTDGAVEVNGGTKENTLTFENLVTFNGGKLDVLSGTASGGKAILNKGLTMNSGTLTVKGGDNEQKSGKLVVSGTSSFNTGSKLVVEQSGAAQFGGNATFASGTVTNSGTIEALAGATINTDGTAGLYSASGKLKLASGATLNFTGASLDLSDAAANISGDANSSLKVSNGELTINKDFHKKAPSVEAATIVGKTETFPESGSGSLNIPDKKNILLISSGSVTALNVLKGDKANSQIVVYNSTPTSGTAYLTLGKDASSVGKLTNISRVYVGLEAAEAGKEPKNVLNVKGKWDFNLSKLAVGTGATLNIEQGAEVNNVYWLQMHGYTDKAEANIDGTLNVGRLLGSEVNEKDPANNVQIKGKINVTGTLNVVGDSKADGSNDQQKYGNDVQLATLVNISCTNKSMKSWFACTLSLQSNVEAAAI